MTRARSTRARWRSRVGCRRPACTGRVGRSARAGGRAARRDGRRRLARASRASAGRHGGPPAPRHARSASLAPARVWRLTDAQYVNVVAQVFGVRVPSEVTAADAAPPDFSNFSEAPELTVQASTVTAYQKAAHAAATTAVAANLPMFLPCGKAPSDACVQGFIRNRVARAFGRLVTDSEVQDLLAMYHAGLAESVAAGVRMIIEATLQSPSFLYRTELGPQAAGGPTAKVKLTPFELASAVSFALLDSVPDDELWGHAVDGTLTTPVGARRAGRPPPRDAGGAGQPRQAGGLLARRREAAVDRAEEHDDLPRVDAGRAAGPLHERAPLRARPHGHGHDERSRCRRGACT